MNTIKKYLLLLTVIVFAVSINVNAQSFVFEPMATTINDSVNAEIIFDFELQNTSSEEITVVVERTENITPQSWSCSLCFFENCYAPFVDTVSTRVSAGESVPFSVHVFALGEEGTATVSVKAYAESNPDENYNYTLTANATITAVEDIEDLSMDFELYQNYPNPFNPTTNIKFTLPNVGTHNNVSQQTKLVVYNLLGQQVAILIDEQKSPGIYDVQFDGLDLTSGIYFYKLTYGSYSLTKKMILEK